MMAPAQYCLRVFESMKFTIHGQEFIEASRPPITLFLRDRVFSLRTPQAKEEPIKQIRQ
jgi:hypothetical protein